MTANILVVDDIEQNIRLMEAKLLNEYYTVFTATSGQEALNILKEHKIDVVLLDCMMPEMDGFETCKLIKSNPLTTHIPVVIVTALSDMEDRIHGLEVGADEFITKPVNDTALFARIKSLVRVKYVIDELKLRNATNLELGIRTIDLYQDFSRCKIAVIDDDIVQAKYITNLLNQLTTHIRVASDGNMLPSLMSDGFIPDATIISCQLDDQDPLRLLASLRADQNIGSSSIMMLTEETNMKMVVKALEMGASDYIIVPIEQSEFIARIKTQLRKKYYQDALRLDITHGINLSIRDGLSGLYNRRYFDTHLNRLIVKSLEEEKALYLVMIDIDYFKNVNDEYGHTTGDYILKTISNIISNSLRAQDTIARYGGEEFVIIIYDISETQMISIAERLRALVEAYDFAIPNSELTIHKTISIGVTKYINNEPIESLISRADKALYKSKNSGRNTITIAPNEA